MILLTMSGQTAPTMVTDHTQEVKVKKLLYNTTATSGKGTDGKSKCIL